jgi:hypothetical protein
LQGASEARVDEGKYSDKVTAIGKSYAVSIRNDVQFNRGYSIRVVGNIVTKVSQNFVPRYRLTTVDDHKQFSATRDNPAYKPNTTGLR